jgi:hypothetical protein
MINEEYTYSYTTAIITNIKVNRNTAKNSKVENSVIPCTITVELPENITKLLLEKNKDAYDIVESFAYNAMTKRFGMEVSYLQVYLPFDSDDLYDEDDEEESARTNKDIAMEEFEDYLYAD